MRVQQTFELSPEQDTAQEWNALLNSNTNEAESEAATTLEVSDAEQLLREGQLEAQRWRRVEVVTNRVMALCWLVGLSLLIFRPFAHVSPFLDDGIVGYLVIIIGWQAARRYRQQMSASRLKLAKRYTEVSDKRLIPLGLMLARDRSVNNTMLTATLIRFLPSLTYSDMQTWSGEQKAALLTVLELPLRDYRLALAVLKALEQIGDESALPTVQKLANMRREIPILREDILKLFSPNLNKIAAQVKQQANQCLPYLTERANEQRQAQTLLRGAATDAPSANVLLRPATGETDPQPAEQLLRPTEKG